MNPIQPDAREAVHRLRGMLGVKKIVAGAYSDKKHAHPAGLIKFVERAAHGAKVRVFTRDGMQNFHVYADDVERFERGLTNGHAPAPAPQEAAPPEPASKPAGQPFVPPRLVRQKRNQPVYPADPAPLKPAVPADSDVSGRMVTVTPDIAYNWLEHNSRNRDLNSATVDYYAAQMKAGQWLPGGAVIKFDRDGNILNGQHCLWAVITANVSIEVYVMSGLDPQVFMVEDTHRRRSVLDSAKVAMPGVRFSTSHVGCASMLRTSMEWVQGRLSSVRPSRQDELAFLGKHEAAVRFADSVLSNKRGAGSTRGIKIAPVAAVLARAFYTVDQDKLRRFAGILTTGLVDDPRENSAVLLRNWLLGRVGIASASSGEARRDIYRRTERVLRAFLDGEVLKFLKAQQTHDELFPLPEEPKRRRPRKETTSS